MNMALLFVYGTLRKGGPNHRLIEHRRCLGAWRTRPRYTLYDLGDYPGAVRGGRTPVCGELYRIDPPTLRILDRLEDYPRLYTRMKIATRYGRAWMYVLKVSPRRRRILSGDWMAP
ncbi:MAG: gamma-glutamylcyclotransferase family protein [Pseudomonadota bacterium]